MSRRPQLSAAEGEGRRTCGCWWYASLKPEDTLKKKKTYHSRVRINAHKQLHAQADLAHHAAMALEDMSRL